MIGTIEKTVVGLDAGQSALHQQSVLTEWASKYMVFDKTITQLPLSEVGATFVLLKHEPCAINLVTLHSGMTKDECVSVLSRYAEDYEIHGILETPCKEGQARHIWFTKPFPPRPVERMPYTNRY